jgi:hypothetical protein
MQMEGGKLCRSSMCEITGISGSQSRLPGASWDAEPVECVLHSSHTRIPCPAPPSHTTIGLPTLNPAKLLARNLCSTKLPLNTQTCRIGSTLDDCRSQSQRRVRYLGVGGAVSAHTSLPPRVSLLSHARGHTRLQRSLQRHTSGYYRYLRICPSTQPTPAFACSYAEWEKHLSCFFCCK